MHSRLISDQVNNSSWQDGKGGKALVKGMIRPNLFFSPDLL